MMILGQEARSEMNKLGSARSPFFFVISYDLDHCLIIPKETSTLSRAIGISLPLGSFEQNMPEASDRQLPDSWDFTPHPQSLADYKRSFDCVMAHLKRGDTYLCNLCAQTPVSTNLRPEQIFEHAHAPYRLYLGADPSTEEPWSRPCVCFSPESFVQIRGNEISCYPMKGTADSDSDEARHWLEHDEKEQRESAMMADLMRNDLAIVSQGVKVVRYRYISPVTTSRGRILQCSSEIRSTLSSDWHSHLGDILFRLLPAGSITGAPKEATCQAIAEAENFTRGFYTGIFGYYDGTNLDSAVAIRFAEQTPEGLLFKSGGGITILSQLDQEYQESIAKVYVPFDL